MGSTMFSFRKDKMGFINGLILMSIAGVTLISTVLLWAVWGWDQCGTAIKVIWGTAWVLCIIAVIVRVQVFKHQREKAVRTAPPPEEKKSECQS
jgi:hypothetical protein